MTNPLMNAFRRLSIATLTNTMKSDPEMARRFNSLSPSKKKEIEAEIERRAELIASSMYRKMQEHGLLEKEPSPIAITKLYREALRENELS